MTTLLIIFLMTVTFGKWILFIGLLPFQKAYAIYQSDKKNKVALLLCLPYYIVNKLCGGGMNYILYTKLDLFRSIILEICIIKGLV